MWAQFGFFPLMSVSDSLSSDALTMGWLFPHQLADGSSLQTCPQDNQCRRPFIETSQVILARVKLTVKAGQHTDVAFPGLCLVQVLARSSQA